MAKRPGFISQRRQKFILLLFTTFRTLWGSPSVYRGLHLYMNLQREPDHPPPSSDEVKLNGISCLLSHKMNLNFITLTLQELI